MRELIIAQMIKVAIIGTSGRNPMDSMRLTADHMKWMAENVLCYIEHVIKTTTDNIILISGGSAWADHVAVQLYLSHNFAGLELYLPTDFDVENKKYANTYEGTMLNLLHSQCKEKINIDVLNELAEAIPKRTTTVVIKRGFLQRNSLVSKKCDHLICFVFSHIISGGSNDTWKKTKHQNKIVFDLSLA